MKSVLKIFIIIIILSSCSKKVDKEKYLSIENLNNSIEEATEKIAAYQLLYHGEELHPFYKKTRWPKNYNQIDSNYKLYNRNFNITISLLDSMISSPTNSTLLSKDTIPNLEKAISNFIKSGDSLSIDKKNILYINAIIRIEKNIEKIKREQQSNLKSHYLKMLKLNLYLFYNDVIGISRYRVAFFKPRFNLPQVISFSTDSVLKQNSESKSFFYVGSYIKHSISNIFAKNINIKIRKNGNKIPFKIFDFDKYWQFKIFTKQTGEYEIDGEIKYITPYYGNALTETFKDTLFMKKH